MTLVQGTRSPWGLCVAALMAGAWVMPAAAADLGGNCCADLEERVAELEATTARKGNRKVSLTISGWVNENVLWWDDGTERNAYIGTSPVEQSRLRLFGEAKINADWSAGYLLEIGVWGGNGSKFDQNSPDGATGANSLTVRKSSWFVKSKTFGKLSVGQDSTATYHLLDDADTTMTRNFYDAEGPPDYLQTFFLRDRAGNKIGSGSGLKWGDALRGFNNSTPGDNGRRNVVRYESPTFAGFNVATAWGEDDVWDVALIYKGEAGDFNYNARAGYGKSTDGFSTPCHGSSTSPDNALNCEWWGVSAFLQHAPTGLFVYGGYGKQRDGSNNPGVDVTIIEKDSTTWFVQGGIEKKWIPLGKTNIFGMYRKDDGGTNPGKTLDSNIDFWAVGAAQNIEATEATLYLVYQRADGDVTTPAAGPVAAQTRDLSAMQQAIGGMKINF